MKKQHVLAIIIILFSMCLRLYSPEADPPPDLSWSGGLWFDEGNQCHNARSKILFNKWFPDEWNDLFYAPLLGYFKYLWFKIAGVGLLQERLVSHFFAFLTIIFFYLIIHKNIAYPFNLIALFLLGINYITIMYNRVGMFETPMIFITVLSLYFLIEAKDRKLYLFLAGIFSFLIYSFKNLYICFVPVPLFAYLIYSIFKTEANKNSYKKIAINCLCILCGIIIALSLWYFTFYLPNRDWILYSAGEFIKSVLFPKDFQEGIKNVLRYPLIHYYKRMPVVWVFTLLYFPVLIRKLINRKANLTEISFALLFLAHLIFFSFISYRPIRYFVAPIPAMAFLAASMFEHIIKWRTSNISYSKLKKAILYLFDLTWIVISSYLCFIPLIWIILNKPIIYLHLYQYLILSILLIIFAKILLSLYKNFLENIFHKLKLWQAFVLLLLLLCSYINLQQYITWQLNKTYKVRDISRKLGEELKDAYIAGLTAPAFNLENKHKSLFLWENFVNYKEPFQKYPLTHAILGLFNKEIHYYFGKWPEIMNQAYLADVFNLRNTIFHLYAFKEPIIAEAKQEEFDTINLKIINKKDSIVNTKLRTIYLFENDFQRNSADEGYAFGGSEDLHTLKPGENNLIIKMPFNFSKNPIVSLIYLEEANKKNIFRYEAEMLKRETGYKIKDQAASDNYKIVFDKGKHTKGFLGFGPFIPYREGFFIVKYKIMYKNIDRNSKDVALFEVSSNHGKRRFAYRHVGGAGLVQDKYIYETLYFMNPGTNELEFRLYAFGGADIEFDCIDIEYYQGKIIQPFSN